MSWVCKMMHRTSMMHRRLLLTAAGTLGISMRANGCVESSRGISSKAISSHRLGEEYALRDGTWMREHFFTMPLRHGEDDGQTITMFVRELVAGGKKDLPDLPCLLYLQGGPGFPAGRPSTPISGWTKSALGEYRVLLVDQRGTGRSSAVTAQNLALVGGGDPEAQAEYVTHFRADSIVKDCEVARVALCGKDSKITLLGQSFGGFCILSYLSMAPESITRALFTFGLAPIQRTPDEVYTATYKRVLERNRRFYGHYPGDIPKVRRIVAHLLKHEEEQGGLPLPGGGKITARRFLQLGIEMGSKGGMDSLHWLLEDAWVAHQDCDTPQELSYAFLRGVEDRSSYDTNPLYWLLHEAIYCDGSEDSPGAAKASNWAAHRVRQSEDNGALFDPSSRLRAGEEAEVLFTGEMVYPWMSEDYATLGKLRGCAEILAIKTDWGPLYDRDCLDGVASQVPCAAIIAYEDLYVEREYSEETAALLGPGAKLWISNEFQHSGLGDDPHRVLQTLLGMTKCTVMVPS